MGIKKHPLKKYPIIEEEWKECKFDKVKKNYYSVSNLGRYKNINGLMLKATEINSGYLVYSLINESYTCYNDKYTKKLGHRGVMETFAPTVDMDKKVVNHIDHNKHNNCLYNLEWMSERDNNIDSIDYHHAYGENHYSAKFNTEQLKIIAQELEKCTCYADILIKIGVEVTDNNKDSIGNIKRGITYQHELRNIM